VGVHFTLEKLNCESWAPGLFPDNKPKEIREKKRKWERRRENAAEAQRCWGSSLFSTSREEPQ
jgi:hypothetical protein